MSHKADTQEAGDKTHKRREPAARSFFKRHAKASKIISNIITIAVMNPLTMSSCTVPSSTSLSSVPPRPRNVAAEQFEVQAAQSQNAPPPEQVQPPAASSIAQQPPVRYSGDEYVNQRIVDVLGWRTAAIAELKTNLLNNLEAGLQRIDPNFSFTRSERLSMQQQLDVLFKAGSSRIVVVYDPNSPNASECFHLTDEEAQAQLPIQTVENPAQYVLAGGTIVLNAAQLDSSVETEVVLRHEAFHMLSMSGASPDSLAVTSQYFKEGAAELLTQLAMQSEDEGVAYPLQTFSVYALLKSGELTLPAFLSANFGSNYQSEFSPDPSYYALNDQLHHLNPGLASSLFPASSMQEFLSRNETQYAENMQILFDTLSRRGANIDGLMDSAKSDINLDLFAFLPQ